MENENLNETTTEDLVQKEEVVETPVETTSNEPILTNYDNNTTANNQANASSPNTASGFSIASLILGIVSIFAAFFALFGYITSITGLVLGIVGRKKDKSNISIVGIVFSSLGIVASLLSSLIGVITFMAALY